jgi:hypothetical protein
LPVPFEQFAEEISTDQRVDISICFLRTCLPLVAGKISWWCELVNHKKLFMEQLRASGASTADILLTSQLVISTADPTISSPCSTFVNHQHTIKQLFLLSAQHQVAV